ncbi:MAG: hypothetical protein FWE13_02435 [Firmicutes bacterium]|nr:hypothetical protein [Bacillota bacterium]
MSEETLKTGSEVVPRKRKKKSKNPIVNYFVPFRLKQFNDLLMLASFVVVIVGVILHGTIADIVVMIVGASMFAVGSVIAIFRCVRVLRSDERTKTEKKDAKINLILMSILLAVAILAIVASFMLWGS